MDCGGIKMTYLLDSFNCLPEQTNILKAKTVNFTVQYVFTIHSLMPCKQHKVHFVKCSQVEQVKRIKSSLVSLDCYRIAITDLMHCILYIYSVQHFAMILLIILAVK